MRLLSFYLHVQAVLMFASIYLGAACWIYWFLEPYMGTILRVAWMTLLAFFAPHVLCVVWFIRWMRICYLAVQDWRTFDVVMD